MRGRQLAQAQAHFESMLLKPVGLDTARRIARQRAKGNFSFGVFRVFGGQK